MVVDHVRSFQGEEDQTEPESQDGGVFPRPDGEVLSHDPFQHNNQNSVADKSGKQITFANTSAPRRVVIVKEKADEFSKNRSNHHGNVKCYVEINHFEVYSCHRHEILLTSVGKSVFRLSRFCSPVTSILCTMKFFMSVWPKIDEFVVCLPRGRF